MLQPRRSSTSTEVVRSHESGHRAQVRSQACPFAVIALDLAEPRATDGRRLEVVVDGLLFGGSQLVVDTTVVCAPHCDGSPHRGVENLDGVVLEIARRRKDWWGPEKEPILLFLALRLEAACPWRPRHS